MPTFLHFCMPGNSWASSLVRTLKRRLKSLYTADELYATRIAIPHTRRASAGVVTSFLAEPCAALSGNWLSTVARTRLALIRRLAATNREMLSRNLVFSIQFLAALQSPLVQSSNIAPVLPPTPAH